GRDRIEAWTPLSMRESDGASVRREFGERRAIDVEHVHDPCERLIDRRLDLGRSKAGERRGEIAEQMLEAQTKPERLLGDVASAPLEEQACDQRGFDHEDRQAGEELPAIEPPEGYVAEPHDAAGGQRGLRNPKTRQLPRVEHVGAADVLDAVSDVQ